MAPGGRSGGSEKILPICACAGGASEVVVAAIRAARPVRAMVRSISRLLQANRARDIVQAKYRLIRRSRANRLTRGIRRGKGVLPPSGRTSIMAFRKAETADCRR